MNVGSTGPGTVLITATSVLHHPPALERLRAAGCELIVQDGKVSEDWLLTRIGAVDALAVSMEPITARLLAAAPRLKIIARPGVGYDTVDLAAATAQGVVVTVAAGTNHQSVADHTFALLLAAARNIVPANAGIQAHGWDRPAGIELWRKTLAVVGLGRIGRAVVQRARGFDMRVLAVARTPDPELAAAGVEFVDLPTALRSADVVSLHLPYTPENDNLIDAAALASMKRGALLINTARGGLIDEAALAAAVRSGHLAGAAVDVLRQQGANSPSPLIGVPGIILTPHIATFTPESMARVAGSVVDAILARLAGQVPDHVVNPAALAVRR